jgi:hypothetical protein
MHQSIKTILEAIIDTQNNWKMKLLTQWPTILGQLGTKVSCEKIDEDALTLGVKESCWMHELYVLSPVIIDKINQNLDHPRIKRVFLKQMHMSRSSRKQEPQHSTKKHRVVTFSRTEHAALEKICDKKLQKVLGDFLIRCYQERP